MKKKLQSLILIVFLLQFVSNAFCQSNLFEKNTNLINLAFGFGDYPGKKGTQETTIFPNTMLSFEHGITDYVGMGYFSLGAHVGIAAANGTNPITKTDYSSTFFYFSGRTQYHIDFYRITREPFFQKFDSNIGLCYGIGYRMESYDDNTLNKDETESHTSLNIILGGRYYINNRTSISLEILGGNDNCVYLGLGIKM